MPVISSQAIGENFLFHNPLVKMQKIRVDRQRLAEFLQVMNMVFFRGSRFRLKISFGEVLTSAGENKEAAAAFYESIKEKAEKLLDAHLAAFPARRQVLWTEKPKHFRS